jgi:5-methylcytosine-specific restriction endonuclease McrA
MSPIEINLSLTKKCSSCKQTKPRAEFTKNKTKPSGLGPSCRPCHRGQDKAYRARRTQEAKERRWARERTPAKRLRDQVGRHRRLYGGDFTVPQWLLLLALYGYICLCCGKHAWETPEGALTIDHIVPCSSGGANSFDNIQPLCLSCNCKKGSKETDYRPGWLALQKKGFGIALAAAAQALAS